MVLKKSSKAPTIFLLFLLVILFWGCAPRSLHFSEGGTKKFSGAFFIKSEGIKSSGTFVTKYEVNSNGIDYITSGKSYFYSSFGPRLLTLKEQRDSVELHPRKEEPFTISSNLILNLGEGFPELPITYATFLRTLKGKLPLEVTEVIVDEKESHFTVPIKNSKYAWDVLISRRGERIENVTLTLAGGYTITFTRPGAGFFYEIVYTTKNSDYIKIRYDS